MPGESFEDVPLVECMYLVFTCMLGESYRRRPESPTVILHQMYIFTSSCEDVLLVEFIYFVFTRMPGESYRRRLGSWSSEFSGVVSSCFTISRSTICTDVTFII